ncbi:MAG: endo-1,4-beta-xylanase, partial [Candidatus Marinimicrobia bacterium]|nr:endo-1,4-beta-xylanase [Candidatus Neomarinimicrobiota bacterium]
MQNGKITFQPYFVQKGRGPHLDDFAFASDTRGDTFKSDIEVNKNGVVISDTDRVKSFYITVRWNVEGYGYLQMPADNGGKYYQISNNSRQKYNLNFELALTRVFRNRRRLKLFYDNNWEPSRELNGFVNLAENYLNDAKKRKNNPEQCAKLSQKALKYGLIASELIEFEKARFDIQMQGERSDFLFGCDGRGYFQMNENLFLERFTELFNYATITHYLIGDFVDFEPKEDQKQFKERDQLLDKLIDRGVTVEGRPLFWTHKWVTPDWLKKKKYPQVLKYLEEHIRTVVGHYGDRIAGWEVVNELHDWANELELDHKQSIELTKFACEVARDVNPDITLLINNCCPFGEYVQKGKWHEKEAQYAQRTPYQFTEELIEAGVDFDAVGVQVYFTRKPIADYIRVIERYEKLNKEIQLAEVGAPSRGISQEFIDPDIKDHTQLP